MLSKQGIYFRTDKKDKKRLDLIVYRNCEGNKTQIVKIGTASCLLLTMRSDCYVVPLNSVSYAFSVVNSFFVCVLSCKII